MSQPNNGSVIDATTVWCGGCGAWYRAQLYRVINAADDPELVERFLAEGFAGIHHSECPACGWSYVAEERVGLQFPERQSLFLIVPPGLRHRAQRLRANFVADVARAPGGIVPPYLLEPILISGPGELAEMLAESVPDDSHADGSVDEGSVNSVESMSVSGTSMSASGSGSSVSLDETSTGQTQMETVVRRRTNSLNLLAELLNDEEDGDGELGSADRTGSGALLGASDRTSAQPEEFSALPSSDSVKERLRALFEDDLGSAQLSERLTDPSDEPPMATIEPEAMPVELEEPEPTLRFGAPVELAPEAAAPKSGDTQLTDAISAEMGYGAGDLSEDSAPDDQKDMAAELSPASTEVIDGPSTDSQPSPSDDDAESPVDDFKVDDEASADAMEVEEQGSVEANVTSSPDGGEPSSEANGASEAVQDGPYGASAESPTIQEGGASAPAPAGGQESGEPLVSAPGVTELETEVNPGEQGIESVEILDEIREDGIRIANGQVLLRAAVQADLVKWVQESERAVRFQQVELDSGWVRMLSLIGFGQTEFEIESHTWVLDPSYEVHNEVLNLLGEVFTVRFELSSGDAIEPFIFEIGAPLEQNVRRSLSRSSDFSVRAYEACAEGVESAGVDPVGKMHHNFTADSFNQLLTAAETKLALGIVQYWLTPEQEAYLLDVKSFPAEWWDRIVQRVADSALRFGLAAEEQIKERMMASAGLATDGALLERLIAHFSEVHLNLRPNELDPVDGWSNWDALLVSAETHGVALEPEVEEMAKRAFEDAEKFADPSESIDESYPAIELSLAEAIDVASFGPASLIGSGLIMSDSGAQVVTEPAMASLSEDELVAALAEPERRAGATVHLVGRGLAHQATTIFDAVKRMTTPELIVVVPSLLPMSEHFAPLFRGVLYADQEGLRFAAAMFLAEVGDERALNAILAMLLEPDEEQWELFAETAARLGPMLVQPALSRAALDETSAYRVAVLLGYLMTTTPDALSGLTHDDPAVVACVQRAKTVAEALGKPELPPFANRLTRLLEVLLVESTHG